MDTIYEEGAGNNTKRPQPIRRILQPNYKYRQQPPHHVVKKMKSPPIQSSSTDPLTVAIVDRVTNRPDSLIPVRVLGEGAFGEVILVVDKDDQSISAAMKRISLRGLEAGVAEAVRKEALLQRAVKGHENVLKFLTMRSEDDFFELYLELADAGELFDQIEPDYGMEPCRAQFYFRQLINGLQHIHAAGIAHRDIKPENLLLTRKNILKISDFGMATLFRSENGHRILTTKCGTMSYAAPEILSGRYNGEPVDVWSCGIVLVTMIIGELPWVAPKRECREFAAFVNNEALQLRPWSRLDTIELSMLTMILTENPSKRATIPRIKKHPWYVANLGYRPDWKRKIIHGNPAAPRSAKISKMDDVIPSSQPAFMRSMKEKDSLVLINSNKPYQPLPAFSFSQPVNFDSMLLNQSQVIVSQFANYAHPIASLVRRMTRFCVTVNVEHAIKAIENACKLSQCEFRQSTSHQIQITCIKHEELSFLATIYEMVDEGVQKVLVDFRLSKGDGLEFKRKFLELQNHMSKYICKNSSSWLEKHGIICRRPACDIVAAATQDPRVRDAKAIVVGKPEPSFYQSALSTLGIKFPNDKIVMIGDDVIDDVNGALNIGYKAILVKTGKYREGDEHKIDSSKGNGMVFESVTHAIKAILEDDGNKFFA